MGAIIGMAQTFVGSNNINLLFPSGQFGTRLMGGSDAASPRYIFTKVSLSMSQFSATTCDLRPILFSFGFVPDIQIAAITRALFHPDDDPILRYMVEDGCDIEPETYAPVVSMEWWHYCICQV